MENSKKFIRVFLIVLLTYVLIGQFIYINSRNKDELTGITHECHGFQKELECKLSEETDTTTCYDLCLGVVVSSTDGYSPIRPYTSHLYVTVSVLLAAIL